MTTQSEISKRQTWSAVGSMALCVALLIASEFNNPAKGRNRMK
jgi:hypothetical protein